MRTLSLLLITALSLPAAQFLWLSDIHFDPLADPTLVDKLAATEPAQWAQILSTGSQKMPPFGQDTNWALLSSLKPPKSDFTIVTGDLLVHHFREHFDAAAKVHDDAAFRAFVRKSIEFVALQLKQPAIVALGNNDDECADYAIQPGGPFLQDTAKTITSLAGVADPASYIELGSYSALVKKRRIIVLETLFFSPRYRDACGHSTEDMGAKLLAWLKDNLEKAKSAHEKVWLVYHIPPGIDAFATSRLKQPGAVTLLWKEAYTLQFVDLLTQYSDTVQANLAGHVHVDDFRLLGGAAPPVVINPAFSPITSQNPSYRLVKFNSKGALLDQTTYIHTDAGWHMEYNFQKEWRLSGLNSQSYVQIFNRVDATPETADRWKTVYSASNPAASTIVPANFRQFSCTMANIFTADYLNCVNNHAKNSN